MVTVNLSGRSRTTEPEILIAFADRLKTIPNLNEQNVVISDQLVPIFMPAGRLCVSVSPGDGVFPQKAWAGGGHATATEDGTIGIGIYQTIRRDRPGRSEQTILADDSLLDWKRRILSALTVENKSMRHASQAWEPMRFVKGETVEEDTLIPLLREPPRPLHVTGVQDVAGHTGWNGIQFTFSCLWDWDLYGGT